MGRGLRVKRERPSAVNRYIGVCVAAYLVIALVAVGLALMPRDGGPPVARSLDVTVDVADPPSL